MTQSPSPKSIHGRKPKVRRQLLKFGELIRAGREKQAASQLEAVKVLARHGLKISKSWIAQLESGKITEPSPEILRQIGEAYGLDYDRLVYTLVQDKFRLQDLGFMPESSRLRWQAMGELLHALDPINGTKLEKPQLIAKSAALGHEILTLEGVGQWLAGFSGLKEIAFILPRFQDERDPTLLAALTQLLTRGTRCFFFLPKTDLGEGGAFWRFIQYLGAETRKSPSQLQRHLLSVPIEESALRWIVNDLVVANVTDPLTRSGFVGLRHNEATRIYWRLTAPDLEIAVNGLFPLMIKKSPRSKQD